LALFKTNKQAEACLLVYAEAAGPACRQAGLLAQAHYLIFLYSLEAA
jgi:hypothetical protein